MLSFLENMSFGRATYFTFITALAIGYGDVTPATAGGKVVSVLIGLLGLIILGIVTGISTRAILFIMHPEEFKSMRDK